MCSSQARWLQQQCMKHGRNLVAAYSPNDACVCGGSHYYVAVGRRASRHKPICAHRRRLSLPPPVGNTCCRRCLRPNELAIAVTFAHLRGGGGRSGRHQGAPCTTFMGCCSPRFCTFTPCTRTSA